MSKAISKRPAVAAALIPLLLLAVPGYGRKHKPKNVAAKSQAQNAAPAGTPALAPDYAVGVGDVLRIEVWKQPQMSGTEVVRPDGKITLPFVNDVEVAGLTSPEIRELLTRKLQSFLASPQVTVSVQEIRSRMVYITGKVGRPGQYALLLPTDVMQLIATAGGLAPYAKGKHITVFRNEGGHRTQHELNYQELLRGRNPQQDLVLQPGDVVVVR